MPRVTNFVLRMFDKPRTINYVPPSGNVLSIGGGGYAFYLSVTNVANIDSINAPASSWREGRKIQLIGAIGNGDAITIRDNQAGSNLSVVGTSLTLGAGDSVTFRADKDSSGNKIWSQDGVLVNL